MAIDTNNTVINAIQNQDWFFLMTGAYTQLVGETVFAIVTTLIIITGFWVSSGTITIPAILMLYIAGVVSASLPYMGSYAAYVFVTMAFAASLWKAFDITRG